MQGAAGVAALVLLEWCTGIVAVAAWSQSWGVVRRGHFRIVAWSALGLGAFGWLAARAEPVPALAALAPGAGALAYLAAQFLRADAAGAAAGAFGGILGAAGLVALAATLNGLGVAAAAAALLGGALLLGGVTNGMLLGHWYLNQPGLKPWALMRLTTLTLTSCVLALAAGLTAAPTLLGADTSGITLGLAGAAGGLGGVVFLLWLAVLAFTAAVVWMARRCVAIRSIQSATGLYYVALLTGGVAEFVVRYLTVYS